LYVFWYRLIAQTLLSPLKQVGFSMVVFPACERISALGAAVAHSTHTPGLIFCYCFHDAWAAAGGPVVLVVSDQNFPACVPARTAGKECLRIIRCEDSSLQDLTHALLDTIGKARLPRNSVEGGRKRSSKHSASNAQ
jgi:hypothetical protein